ncbi:MAG TPA: metal-dependent hydrolase [Rhodocyclaceae bacterium]
MIPITPRMPEIDWGATFARHWLGGSPARTHGFNALSFLFPQAERFFIEVAREVMAEMEGRVEPKLRRAVMAFIVQEATHTRQHGQYNAILRAQGYENVVYRFVEDLQEESRRHASPLTRLAVVCGYEHYTAILGNYVLSDPSVLASAEPRMALIWGWHSAEETEHKGVCFDLYRAAGGGWLRRVLVFLLVTVNFNVMYFRLYLSLLRRDGRLRPRSLAHTASDSIRFFFGPHGVGWQLLLHGVRYLRPSFHPWQHDNREKLARWLAANREQLRCIG